MLYQLCFTVNCPFMIHIPYHFSPMSFSKSGIWLIKIIALEEYLGLAVVV